MSLPSLSNVFSDVYITGNCVVKGTISSLAGSITSQWTTSGSTIYYTTGNVGIGTNNPTGVNTPGSLLHVYDSTSSNPTVNIDASGGSGQARLHLKAGAGATNRASRIDFFNHVLSTTLPQWTIISGFDQNGTNDLRFVNYAGTITSAWAQNGYVGIGTTNPGSLLTVSGGVAVGSGYQSTLAPTGGLIVQGNVGIGTSNPGVNALQVSGNVVTSGFTSNSTNTVFNFDTLTVPFVNATQIGVGTSVPENKVDVTDGSVVIAPTTFTGATNYGIFFRHGFSTSNFYNCSIIAYDHNADTNPDGISINGYDGVSICTGANTRQERVRVTSAGNVGIGVANPTRPLEVSGAIINGNPAFSAYRSAGSTTVAGTVVFDIASVNRTSSYNTSTGIFTAPVAGLYFFSFFGMANSAAPLWIQFYKNGSLVNAGGNPYNGYPSGTPAGTYNQVSGTIIMSLAVNDTVNLYISSGTMYGTGNCHNGFVGYLIG